MLDHYNLYGFTNLEHNIEIHASLCRHGDLRERWTVPPPYCCADEKEKLTLPLPLCGEEDTTLLLQYVSVKDDEEIRFDQFILAQPQVKLPDYDKSGAKLVEDALTLTLVGDGGCLCAE